MALMSTILSGLRIARNYFSIPGRGSKSNITNPWCLIMQGQSVSPSLASPIPALLAALDAITKVLDDWERQSFVSPPPKEVVDISKYDPLYRSMDGMATHWHHLNDFESPVRGGGEADNPSSMIDLHFMGIVAVLVQHGMSTAIELWMRGNHLTTVLELHNSAVSTASKVWDIKRLSDGRFMIAVIKSSAIHHQPEGVWITFHDNSADFLLEKPLTSHNKQPKDHDIKTSLMEWDNGTKLQGTITYPPTYSQSSAPLPTVLFIHSGPYDRTTLTFKLDKFRLQLLLASHRYLVLSPNYRGSSGRGLAFARVTGSQLITKSWSDCDSLINHAINRKLADPARLSLGEHSSGGYLAALGASITKDKYKACITWSGASDLSSLVASSQTPEFQFSMSGIAPCHGEAEGLMREVGGRMVHPSPVRNLAGVETAFWILHGEDDPQIPVSQAVVLWRGLQRMSRFPERHQLPVYPREGHVFAEKGHFEVRWRGCLGTLARIWLRKVIKRDISNFSLSSRY